jgi:hypothetical protein
VVANDEEDGARFTAPWSRNGWYGREVRGRQNPEIEKLYLVAGRGRVNPIGFTADRPALAMSAGTHNPYLNLPIAVMFLAMGVFLFDKLSASLLGASLLAGFFWLGAIFAIVVNVRRIPSWHRARKLVHEYVDRNGEKFPNELKWYH